MEPNWSNRTLWTGDNLDIMRGMNSETVDLIYLDPPFNSNKNYSAPIGSEAAGAAFKDTWALNDVDEAWHGEIADRDPHVYAAIDAAGLTHGKGMKSYLIMMTVRLMEMRRILKDTGSIYLHCDPTASHYIKAMMDTIFGHKNFRNEIIWKRANAHNDPKGYGRISDTILFYMKGNNSTWNTQYTPYRKEYYDSHFKKDANGRYYRTVPLDAPKHGEGSPNLLYDWKGKMPSPSRTWAVVIDKMKEYDANGLLRYTRTGTPTLLQYADSMKGVPVQDIWTDIPPVNPQAKERLGYPTQKPLALLDRIIKASSNEDDVVLDPFAGCATACVAAEHLYRQWVGIDLSPMAATLVNKRLRADVGELLHEVHHREDIPKRTDLGELPNYRTHRHTLYGKQEGVCAGCQIMFPFRNMTVDHVVPQSKSGTDHLDNLQLLCGACNSAKGAQSQETFIAKLKAEGLRQ